MISLFIMYRVVAGQQWVIETKMQVFDTVLQLGPSPPYFRLTEAYSFFGRFPFV
jgi:hypothetical protein